VFNVFEWQNACDLVVYTTTSIMVLMLKELILYNSFHQFQQAGLLRRSMFQTMALSTIKDIQRLLRRDNGLFIQTTS
jgi:hypothetical protein